MKRIAGLIGVCACALLAFGCSGGTERGVEEHAGHDHASHAGHAHGGDEAQDGHDGHNHPGHDHARETQNAQDAHGDYEDHEGHGHGRGDAAKEEHDDHAGHGHGAHEDGVVLSPEAQRLAGIVVDTVARRTLHKTVELPGRIGYDEEKLAHITPRYAGLARSVPARLGTYVAKGEVLATIESNASMTTYPVVAPFNGHIVEKHLALGEHVTEESEVFLLANLSTVWVNCDVYAANVDDIRVGAQATIQATGSGRTAAGTIRYISPAFDSRSSSGLARIVLANPGLKWRPGMFVRATVAVEQADSALVVHRDAVQVLDGETVVFLPGPHNSFTNTRVVPGRRTREYVEVLEGLREGDAYISGGAFELKATIVTSGMDPHAGHGH